MIPRVLGFYVRSRVRGYPLARERKFARPKFGIVSARDVAKHNYSDEGGKTDDSETLSPPSRENGRIDFPETTTKNAKATTGFEPAGM